MMKRWIVNAQDRSVRERLESRTGEFKEVLKAGEFFWDGSYADAMAAGVRRRLAEEAISGLIDVDVDFQILADRIEPRATKLQIVAENTEDLGVALRLRGYDVWREGSGLVVLGRLP